MWLAALKRLGEKKLSFTLHFASHWINSFIFLGTPAKGADTQEVRTSGKNSPQNGKLDTHKGEE